MTGLNEKDTRERNLMPGVVPEGSANLRIDAPMNNQVKRNSLGEGLPHPGRVPRLAG